MCGGVNQLGTAPTQPQEGGWRPCRPIALAASGVPDNRKIQEGGVSELAPPAPKEPGCGAGAGVL